MRHILAVALCFVACSKDQDARLGCPDAGCPMQVALSAAYSDEMPTFDEALAAAKRCPNGIPAPFYNWGTCADGKRFVTPGGGFAGRTEYFQGNQLVGVATYSDVGIDCNCTTTVAGDTACESPATQPFCVASADAGAAYLGASSAAFRCTESGVLQSSSSGPWVDLETCIGPAFCDPIGGFCFSRPCNPGETRCNGAAFERCSDDRTAWVVTSQCSGPAQCGPGGCG